LTSFFSKERSSCSLTSSVLSAASRLSASAESRALVCEKKLRYLLTSAAVSCDCWLYPARNIYSYSPKLPCKSPSSFCFRCLTEL
jgi:hypothetical protein